MMMYTLSRILSLFLIALMFASCSRKSDRELEQLAKNAEQQKNWAIAVDYYAEIVDRFPQTALAESSQYRIATIYSNDAELKDARRAVHSYLRFHALFPKSPRAPVALFLAGFLYNNELHSIDSARMVYQDYLQQYPDHELAASAKYELETLGKDPNELMKSKIGEAPAADDAKKGAKPSTR